jgi:hypothetical protein
MKFKNKLTMLFLFLCLTIFAQEKEFSVLGKWQEISYTSDNGGGELNTKKIKNGTEFFFETNNSVKKNNGNKGKYQLTGNRLKIELTSDTSYYFVSYSNTELDVFRLTPVT